MNGQKAKKSRGECMKIFCQSPIYAITAENLSAGRKNLEVAEAILSSGVRLLQYREKTKAIREMYKECLAMREMARAYGAVFIVDDFVDLALAVGADGVHIGQDDLPASVVRALVGDGMVIGLSTHSPEQLEKANALCGIVDYFGCGPVYETHTKANPAPVTGLSYIRYAAEHARCPFVAIGGIKEHNIAEVAHAGAKTCAVVSDIVGAGDIGKKISALTSLMGNGNAMNGGH